MQPASLPFRGVHGQSLDLTRLTQCDRDPTCCGSCKRLGILCTGYRDTQKPRFCDETDQVVGKYQHADEPAESSPASTSSPRPLSFNGSNHHDTPSPDVCDEPQAVSGYLVPSKPLGPSLDDFALSFCCGSIGYYQCSLGIIARSISDDQNLLPECLKALGLATCAVAESSTSLSIDAKRYYLSALAKTNTALATFSRATTDSTLLSVMILSNIETIFGSNSQSFEAWSAHISGSTALLNLRGEAQLKTISGRLLFMQASTNIVSNCIRNVAPVPTHLHTLTEAAEPFLSTASHDAVVWAIHRARLTLADLCSAVVPAMEAAVADETAEKALDLDNYLTEMFRKGPPNPSISKSDEEPFPDLNHPLIVRIFWASQCWMSMLVVRLILHLLISAVSRTVNQQPRLQSSYTQSDNLQQSILELVAYQINLAKSELDLDATAAGPATTSRLVSAQAGVSNAVSAMADHLLVESLSGSPVLSVPEDVPILRLSRGYNVISPLLLVGQIASPSSINRNGACRLLRLAGETMGILQADVLAGRLEVMCDSSESSNGGKVEIV